MRRVGDERTIFYSWQSDLDDQHRALIHQSIERAAEALAIDGHVQEPIRVESDTQHVPGAPDIASTIFAKIDAADAFICDVSLVHENTTRKFPNPNVLVELGYAVKALGWERIVPVLNLESGTADQLPFDIRGRRILTFSTESKTAGEDLRGSLEARLKQIFAANQPTQMDIQASLREVQLTCRQRYDTIAAGNAPMPLENPQTWLSVHVFSLHALEAGSSLNLSGVDFQSCPELKPVYTKSPEYAHHYEGYLSFAVRDPDTGETCSYALLSRQSYIESVETLMLNAKRGDFYIGDIEREIIRRVPRYIETLRALGLRGPFATQLSFHGVSDYHLKCHDRPLLERRARPLDRDELELGPVLQTSVDTSIRELRPAIDLLWQCFGFEGSPNYDDEGQWQRR